VAEQGFIKGTSVALTLDLVRERGGEEALRELAQALPPEVRLLLPEDFRPLATQQFPFEAWGEILLAAEDLFGRTQSIVRESSRRGYRKLFQTTYRSWVKDGDPMESIRRMPRLWQQVTTGIGTLDVEERDGHPVIVARLEMPQRYRPLAEERLCGTIEALVEAAGGSARVRCVRQGAASEFQLLA